MYTRFELYCNGEPQGVGLLVGIDNLNISYEEKELLITPFNDDLPIPRYYKISQSKNILAFFTEKGLSDFEHELKEVIEAFENQGLYDIVKVIIPEEQNIVYSDEYQVLVKSPKLKNIEYVY